MLPDQLQLEGGGGAAEPPKLLLGPVRVLDLGGFVGDDANGKRGWAYKQQKIPDRKIRHRKKKLQ